MQGTQPYQLSSDTAGYSDVVFALFSLLGFKFCPRLANLKKHRLYKPRNSFTCPILDLLEPQCINISLIKNHYDEILRVVASLQQGKVVASDLLRTLQSGKQMTDLARAFAELGKLFKTLHILEYIDDQEFRRTILKQLNISEARHSLIRVINYGGRGQLKKRYLEQQQEQMEPLTLVLNAIVYWNTMYMGKAIDALRNQGTLVRNHDIARLSPLMYGHINIYGRYTFELAEEVANGRLRSLQLETLAA